jgi:MFS family permease
MNRSFRLFLAGQATSAFGSVFTLMAVPVVAVRYLGASPAQIGVLAAAGTLPLVLFGLAIGAWADRLPRKRPYLVAGELVAAAAVGAVALGLATGRLSVWALAAVVFVLGLIAVVVETVYFAHLRSLVPEDQLVGARARLQGSDQVGGLLGRALSGPAVAVGLAVPFLIDFVSYLISAVCLLAMRTPEARRPVSATGAVTRAELAGGLDVVRRDPFLRRLAPLLAGQQLAAGMILALVAPFVLTVLDVPTAWYGALFVFAGAAGAAGTGLSILLARGREATALARIGFLGAALAMLVLPLAGGALPMAGAVAALGIGLPYFFGAIANVGLTGVITTTVPEEILGRMSVLLQLAGGGAQVAGALLGGVLAELVGIRISLWIAALVALTTLIALPGVRERKHTENARRVLIRTG